jgi:hypothetical protein
MALEVQSQNGYQETFLGASGFWDSEGGSLSSTNPRTRGSVYQPL